MRKTYEEQVSEFSFDIAEERLMEKQSPGYEKVLDLRDIARRLSTVYDMPFSVVVDELEDGVRKYTRIIKNRSTLGK
jgi:hypothetical protein